MKHAPDTNTASQLRRLAAEVFVFGYPLVLTDAVRRAHPDSANQFHRLPDRGETLAPGLGQEDSRVLRASAWLDLSEGPVVLSLPDMRGRHFVLSLTDAWGETFAAIGSRTYTDAGYDVAVVGPHWHGELAMGLTARRARTDTVWATSRIAAHVPADRAATDELIDQHYLLPLFGGIGTIRPGKARIAAPHAHLADAVAALSPQAFFGRLEALVRRHPLRASDKEMIQAFEHLDIGTTRRGQAAEGAGAFAEAIALGVRDGRAMLRNAVWRHAPDTTPGWRPAPRALPADDPLIRAAAAYYALGAAPATEILTLMCDADQHGRRLDGTQTYRLHFPRGATPPAKAFWSLALATPPRPGELELRRRALTDRDGPEFNRDGSLDIFIQHNPPSAGRAANWLPVPAREFSLAMRLYWPRPEASDGRWSMPFVEQVEPGVGRRRGASPDLVEIADPAARDGVG